MLEFDITGKAFIISKTYTVSHNGNDVYIKDVVMPFSLLEFPFIRDYIDVFDELELDHDDPNSAYVKQSFDVDIIPLKGTPICMPLENKDVTIRPWMNIIANIDDRAEFQNYIRRLNSLKSSPNNVRRLGLINDLKSQLGIYGIEDSIDDINESQPAHYNYEIDFTILDIEIDISERIIFKIMEPSGGIVMIPLIHVLDFISVLISKDREWSYCSVDRIGMIDTHVIPSSFLVNMKFFMYEDDDEFYDNPISYTNILINETGCNNSDIAINTLIDELLDAVQKACVHFADEI